MTKRRVLATLKYQRNDCFLEINGSFFEMQNFSNPKIIGADTVKRFTILLVVSLVLCPVP